MHLTGHWLILSSGWRKSSWLSPVPPFRSQTITTATLVTCLPQLPTTVNARPGISSSSEQPQEKLRSREMKEQALQFQAVLTPELRPVSLHDTATLCQCSTNKTASCKCWKAWIPRNLSSWKDLEVDFSWEECKNLKMLGSGKEIYWVYQLIHKITLTDFQRLVFPHLRLKSSLFSIFYFIRSRSLTYLITVLYQAIE